MIKIKQRRVNTIVSLCEKFLSYKNQELVYGQIIHVFSFGGRKYK